MQPNAFSSYYSCPYPSSQPLTASPLTFERKGKIILLNFVLFNRFASTALKSQVQIRKHRTLRVPPENSLCFKHQSIYLTLELIKRQISCLSAILSTDLQLVSVLEGTKDWGWMEEEEIPPHKNQTANGRRASGPLEKLWNYFSGYSGSRPLARVCRWKSVELGSMALICLLFLQTGYLPLCLNPPSLEPLRALVMIEKSTFPFSSFWSSPSRCPIHSVADLERHSSHQILIFVTLDQSSSAIFSYGS